MLHDERARFQRKNIAFEKPNQKLIQKQTRRKPKYLRCQRMLAPVQEYSQQQS
jgi:hypothetical protein